MRFKEIDKMQTIFVQADKWVSINCKKSLFPHSIETLA